MAGLLLAVTVFSYSQEEGQGHISSSVVRPLQISLVSPIGSNGLESWYITNVFSLNIIGGYAGGVQGAEIGGVYNLLKGDMNGFQVAGFVNTGQGSVTGGQISGFCNITSADVKGLQLSGFTNVVTGDVAAAQITGFANVTNGSATGIQIAGFSNYAGSVPSGVQISGFSNVSKSDTKGGQIAGFSNVSNGDLNGIQISGFVNYAKNVKGAQIGFINIADSVKGVSLGFLSIVKKGYRTFEIGGNESWYATGSFKTGTEQFYNIISVGARLRGNEMKWGWGYGIGTMFPVHDKVKVNVDAISYHINEDSWFTNRLNMLNKLNVCVNYRLNDFVTVFGGASWNVFISDRYDQWGDPVYDEGLVDWASYDRTFHRTIVKMYPGFTAGVRF